VGLSVISGQPLRAFCGVGFFITRDTVLVKDMLNLDCAAG